MYLSRYRVRALEEDALALKYAGVVNIEQYNKLSIKCAFVCLLYVYLN